MPTTALKHLAKRAKISIDRAEHLWDKAEGIINSEYDYDREDPRHWALRMAITKRMMGLKEDLTFSEFLKESRPVFTPKSVEETIELIRQHASDFMPFLLERKFIWRGITSQDARTSLVSTGAAISDPTLTTRRSISGFNYYTILLDNHPNRSHFPKRSRSFIASTCHSVAKSYGSTQRGEDVIIVPYNGVKIGAVNNDDIWQTRINLFGTRRNIEHFNQLFGQLGIEQSLDGFNKFDQLLKQRHQPSVNKFKRIFDAASVDSLDHFLDYIWEAYSDVATEHTVYTTANLPAQLFQTDCTSELWIGGPVILIKESLMLQIIESLRNEI
jgi:hypothetical protein